jgi:hypothetical protein
MQSKQSKASQTPGAAATMPGGGMTSASPSAGMPSGAMASRPDGMPRGDMRSEEGAGMPRGEMRSNPGAGMPSGDMRSGAAAGVSARVRSESYRD